MTRSNWHILLLPLIGFIQSTCFSSTLVNGKTKKTGFELLREKSLRIMSFNIRYNNPDDGENVWPNRKDMVAKLIQVHQADLIGIQEPFKDQIDDLVEKISRYTWFGVGREDEMEKGEFVPIFYRKDRLELIEQSTFWLSEKTQLPGSIGWDAKHSRIVTWGKFRDKITDYILFHFNTHFDKQGRQSRVESAKLLLKEIEKIAKTNPVVVTGDFNCTVSSEPYQILTSGKKNYAKHMGEKLKDTRYFSIHKPLGPLGTISDFKDIVIPERKIDYIFIKNNIRVIKYMTLTDRWGDRFPSDHLPILTEIVIK